MSTPQSDVQQIYTDNPGGLPSQYDTVSDFSVQSIVARIDGSGAAGSFLPTLSIYSQDLKLIARVPSDVTYAIGDTGVVTWSPFLERGLGGNPPAQTFVGARIENLAGQNVANTTNTDRHYSSVSFDTFGMADLGADDRILTVKAAGLYLVISEVNYAANVNGRRIVLIFKNGFYAAGTGTSLGSYSAQAITDVGARTTATAVTLDSFVAGDFISTGTFQASGGILAEGGVGSGAQSYLAAARIGV